MKLLITAMLAVGIMSMAMFVGAFQAGTNQAQTADIDAAVASEVNEEPDTAFDDIDIVDTGIYDVVTTDELTDVKEEVEVLVFTEEETQDALYGDEE